MKNEGFLNLANIPDYNEEDLFIASQWLWNLPHEEKEKITRKFYRGIVKVSKGDPSQKTFLEIGDESFDEKAKLPRLYEKIYWPYNDQGFKEIISKYQKIFQAIFCCFRLHLPPNHLAGSNLTMLSKLSKTRLRTHYCSVRPNKFLDAAFHRFDGGNKQKEGMVRTSTAKRGVFLGSR